MKNIFLILVCTTLCSATFGQGQQVYTGRAAKVNTGGKFNSSTIGGGTVTATATQLRNYDVFPLYTRTVTVTDAANDTVWQELHGEYSQVHTWVHAELATGTNTTCTVKLQATADKMAMPALTADWKTIKTYTISATGNPYDHTVNSDVGTGGWQYRALRWIFDGAGTHTTTYYGGLEVK